MHGSGALCMSEKEETKEEPKTEETDVDYGVLKVGMDGAHAPYCAVNEESGELEGFEVDVMNEVSERTGLKMELEVASWDGILECLTADSLQQLLALLNQTMKEEKNTILQTIILRLERHLQLPKEKAEKLQQ